MLCTRTDLRRFGRTIAACGGGERNTEPNFLNSPRRSCLENRNNHNLSALTLFRDATLWDMAPLSDFDNNATMRIYRSNLLSGLPELLSSRLFAGSAPYTLVPDQALFSVGDLGNGCYRLKEGLLKIVISSPQGEARIISILGPGAIVGELSMIDRLPRSASVIAVTDSALQFVSRERFDEFAKDHPEIREYLLQTLASRLRDADEALAAATFLTVKGRVARALLELAEFVGEDNKEGQIILNHKISQSDLAAMAGVARENVSRTLSEWQRRNLVVRTSNYYCLNDQAALKREMDFDS